MLIDQSAGISATVKIVNCDVVFKRCLLILCLLDDLNVQRIFIDYPFPQVIDMQNEVEKKGRIFFPDFCKLSLRKFREFDETHFRQELFKVGDNFLAQKYLLVFYENI